MKALTARGDVERFIVSLRRKEQAVLMVDYDGTLAPFRVERDQAVPYPGVRDLLEAILAAGRSRLVVVSGRAVDELVPLLGLRLTPEIWGSHGWEHLLPDGTLRLGDIAEEAARALAHLDDWAESGGYTVEWERKPVSRAFHWRGLAPESIGACRAGILEAWEPVAGRAGLEIHEFDGGLEMRVPGRDKGYAVRQVLSETSSGAAVAYLGDDYTDEDAFRALGQRGMGILVRDQFRPTAADQWFTPPGDLLDFLKDWVSARNALDCAT